MRRAVVLALFGVAACGSDSGTSNTGGGEGATDSGAGGNQSGTGGAASGGTASGGTDGSGGTSSGGNAGSGGGPQDTCENVGDVCMDTCPEPLVCDSGACLPESRGDCGGFAGAPCTTGVCLYCDGCDFGWCFSPAEIACLCATSAGKALYQCP